MPLGWAASKAWLTPPVLPILWSTPKSSLRRTTPPPPHLLFIRGWGLWGGAERCFASKQLFPSGA